MVTVVSEETHLAGRPSQACPEASPGVAPLEKVHFNHQHAALYYAPLRCSLTGIVSSSHHNDLLRLLEGIWSLPKGRAALREAATSSLL